MQDKDLAGIAAKIVGRSGARLSARAASFLLLADSRASFEIEGERPPRNRIERWGRAIRQAGKYPLSIDGLDRLQEILIEDTRFTHAGLRNEGVFRGERGMDGEPLPEFIGARAEDLPALLSGMIASNERMKDSGVDPVIHAAATAFGFIYIHPYEDGNGRIHRWMVHQILAQRGFTPEGMIFPVSSVMLDRVAEYRRTLQDHTGPLMRFIEWMPTDSRNVEVRNDTADLYSYFDCTNAAEFLQGCVSRTVEHDLPAQIEFLQRQDDAQRRIMDAVEMPDQAALDLIMFMRQNHGRISMRRRKGKFEALTDDEVREIETIYKKVFGGDVE